MFTKKQQHPSFSKLPGFLSGEIEDPASVGDESSSGGGASGGEGGGDGSGRGGDTSAAVSGPSTALGGTVDASGLELSTANASQNALCVIKLSFLHFQTKLEIKTNSI